MPPKKGNGRAKRSHPDAEEVVAEGQVNVHVNIHPAPPEEDMPAQAARPSAEAVPPQRVVAIGDWLCNQSWRSAIGRATSHGDLRLVVQPVMAVCDWSYNQSWRSAIGSIISRSDLRLVMRLPVTSLAITL